MTPIAPRFHFEMHIDIYSDVICPWCYLGDRRFTEALDRVGIDHGVVRYRAFQLDPTATSEPSDLRRSLEAKYGPGSFDSMTHRLTALGEDAGIDYRFDLALRVSTADAHRVIAWAATEPPGQRPIVERLFHAYFTDGANIADQQVLTSLAADAGYDGEAAASMLSSDRYTAEVAADLASARESGISGVPAFVIDDQFLISGAQDTETFVRLLGRILERTA